MIIEAHGGYKELGLEGEREEYEELHIRLPNNRVVYLVQEKIDENNYSIGVENTWDTINLDESGVEMIFDKKERS